ncbi:MAG: anion permease [Methylobacteriaceae bacterium]|jgi:DASS family divalent anion:Na+ symporter|nr:anion permease [Methylobacteriaceae bacterium]
MTKIQIRNLIITVGVGLVLYLIPAPGDLKPQAWHLFGLTVAIILGFILEPLPIGAVAFVGITIVALTGTLKTADVLTGFASTSMWLIVAAFMFARAFLKTGFGRRIAYVILRAIGGSTLTVGYSLALSDLVISPATPSSMARAGGILFPIARSICSVLGSEPETTPRKAGAYIMQVVYQTEGIVCAMFMTAMAGNPMIVELASKTAGIEISWGMWFLAALLPGAVAMACTPLLLYKICPPELKKTPEVKALAAEELKKMGPMSRDERILAGVFVLVLVLWTTGQWTKLDATVVGMLAACILLLTKVLDWSEMLTEKGAWDIFIWMGSLVALAGQLQKVGFISWFADVVSSSISGLPWLWALILLVVVYMYSHYGFASLTAHISAMYAAFVAVAISAGAPPYLTCLALAYTANICLAITHYSGSPGPMYFGAGYMPLSAWWRVGFIFSVFNLIVWVGIGSLWWKILGLW